MILNNLQIVEYVCVCVCIYTHIFFNKKDLFIGVDAEHALVHNKIT